MKKTVRETRRKNGLLYLLVVSFAAIYLLTFLVRSFIDSQFIQQNDRIHIVIYGQNPAFYSLGNQDPRNYILYYPADLKVQIPGGYGSYRIGSIGKLVHLERKPDIFKKTFSTATSSFITYYFYPDNQEIYYGADEQKEVTKPKTRDLLFMKSNANWLDRIYLALFFANHKDPEFRVLPYKDVYTVRGDVFFMQEEFTKKNIGLFYQKSYRTEKKNVQILYSDYYTAAERMGSILEGSGIRVSDITMQSEKAKKCSVIEAHVEFSQTARDIAKYFNCELLQGHTDVYDIILELGPREDEWEVE